MVVWNCMAAHPPPADMIGRRLLFTVLPRYGPAYTDSFLWFGLSDRVWPKVTHWAEMPPPADLTKGGFLETDL